MALQANALTTLAVLKDELGVKDDQRNAALERLINSASGLIARFCNRQLHYDPAVVETVPGFGAELLFLSRTPVLSIASVTFDGETVDAESYFLKDGGAGLLYREARWLWTARFGDDLAGPSQVPGTEEDGYTVTYAGGYVTPAQASGVLPRTLPFDLEQACLYTCVQMERMRGRFRNIMSETKAADADGWGGLGIPGVAMELLQAYRRAL